jgi:hypothetical protein
VKTIKLRIIEANDYHHELLIDLTDDGMVDIRHARSPKCDADRSCVVSVANFPMDISFVVAVELADA